MQGKKIKREIQRLLMKRGEVATNIFIHSSECHHILEFVLSFCNLKILQDAREHRKLL